MFVRFPGSPQAVLGGYQPSTSIPSLMVETIHSKMRLIRHEQGQQVTLK